MQKIITAVLVSIPLFFMTSASFAGQNTGAAKTISGSAANYKNIAGMNIAYVAAKRCYYSYGRRVCQGAAVGPQGRVYRGTTIRR